MSYIDGFVIAVADVKRDAFIAHATTIDPLFLELGATRVVECWEDQIANGKRTDFRRAVAAEAGEKIAFSWVEWPDKPARDSGMARLSELMETGADPRMDPARNPAPFDGARMIFGGFAPLLNRGSGGGNYVDGFVAPIAADGRDAYRTYAEQAAGLFESYGALRVVESFSDDVPDGKRTDFRRAVAAEASEHLAFSWIEWPDKATRNAGWGKMMADDPLKGTPMPFDGARMIHGGFTPVVSI